jgi:hypothetical protein
MKRKILNHSYEIPIINYGTYYLNIYPIIVYRFFWIIFDFIKKFKQKKVKLNFIFKKIIFIFV